MGKSFEITGHNRDGVTIKAGLLDLQQAEVIRRLGDQLGVSSPAHSTGLEAVALKAGLDSDRQLAISYSLAAKDTDLGAAFDSAVHPSQDEKAALVGLKPAELLLHWEDDELSPEDRGSATSAFFAIPLEPDAANSLRSLVQEMLSTHKQGFIERARSVGYYREAMAIAHDVLEKPVFLLYLELKTDFATMGARLQSYPKTDFHAWWDPQFTSLVGAKLPEGMAETVLRFKLA